MIFDLESRFWKEVSPVPLKAPHLMDLNPEGLSLLGNPDISDWTALHNGELTLNNLTPRCAYYSGHQFGVWAGQLGDGRAHSLGVINGWELQLKGGGLTPFSRMGDGRAVLRSTIREYLAGEYLHALGIPTTRSLGILTSAEPVQRETMETGATMIRLSPSFLRFGTIQHYYAARDKEAIAILLDYLTRTFYPECDTVDALFTAITTRTAHMIAHWMAYGFCHGVMNTDNMSLLGLTLDYGPYGFLEWYDPTHICNHSDTQGRYRFENQPWIGQWNLMALAQALQEHASVERLEKIVMEDYVSAYEKEYLAVMSRRFELPNTAKSLSTINATLSDMTQRHLDHNKVLFERYPTSNPKFVLYNWIGQDVINRVQGGDYEYLSSVREVMQTPFLEHSVFQHFSEAAPPWAHTLSISCSS